MKILLIFIKDHGVSLNILSCLKEHEIHIIGTKKYCPMRFSRRCFYIYMDSLKQKNLTKEINKYCSDNNIEMIIPTDISSFHFLNQNRSKLAYRIFLMDKEDKIKLLENKYLFYGWLVHHKIQTPRTFLIENVKKLHKLNLNYPIIVKPPNLFGCLGIKKINSVVELKEHLKSGLPYTDLPIIAQNYIKGTDIDVSVLCYNGKIVAYTIQLWKELRTLEFVENSQALNSAKHVIKGLNFTGIAHFDMRIEDDTNIVYVIECNPRFWGSIGASFMVGVDFIGLGIKLTAGKNIDIIPGYKKDFYILMGSVLPTLFAMKFKYFTKITLESIREVLADPLPFILTQLGL